MRSPSTLRDAMYADLYRAIRRIVSDAEEPVLQRTAIQQALLSPSSRWWISPRNCALAMGRLDAGDRLPEIKPLRREMYMELYRRYRLLREEHPGCSAIDICEELVLTEAPRYYVTYLSAVKMYNHHIRNIRCQRKRT